MTPVALKTRRSDGLIRRGEPSHRVALDSRGRGIGRKPAGGPSDSAARSAPVASRRAAMTASWPYHGDERGDRRPLTKLLDRGNDAVVGHACEAARRQDTIACLASRVRARHWSPCLSQRIRLHAPARRSPRRRRRVRSSASGRTPSSPRSRPPRSSRRSIRTCTPRSSGRRPGPFSISLQFPPFDAPDYADAVALAKASRDYREIGQGDDRRHRATFHSADAAQLRALFHIVGRFDACEVLVDGRPVPYARELWLPLVWFLLR